MNAHLKQIQSFGRGSEVWGVRNEHRNTKKFSGNPQCCVDTPGSSPEVTRSIKRSRNPDAKQKPAGSGKTHNHWKTVLKVGNQSYSANHRVYTRPSTAWPNQRNTSPSQQSQRETSLVVPCRNLILGGYKEELLQEYVTLDLHFKERKKDHMFVVNPVPNWSI